jgi:hypothetical protein
MKLELPLSIAMTNNYQSESNEISSISVDNGNSIFNENFYKNESHYDFTNFLQHAATLMDRPFSSGLQPLDAMGPNLMKMNTCEQHWIKR